MDLTEVDKQVILALAECDMKISKAARKLYMHRNTIYYHIELIKNKTGCDANKFYDLLKLVDMCH